jgi:hypothetical protein
MKQAENNEIDTLLRNLARREQAARLERGSASQEFAAQGAHLDVDELSSYAERALPPSARDRCSAHLADCDDCRKIVAQLSLAAGPLTEEHGSEQGSGAGITWTQRLLAFFSPPVMRYAMPALVLVVVAFAFFGWRQQGIHRSSDYVARNDGAPAAPAAGSVKEQKLASDRPESTTGKVGDTAKTRDQKETESKPTPAASAKALEQSSDEKKQSAGASSSPSATAAAKSDAAAGDKVAVAQPSYAPEPATPPPARTKAAVGGNAGNEEQPKDSAKNNVADERSRGRDVSVARKGPARGDNEVASQRGPAKRETQAAEKDKSSSTASGARFGVGDDEGEKRTVAGRHFRRVSNAWVDTAYKSAMPMTTVSRGSEQYRALVADEPGIDSIGKQLSGEVIVVWKGHVYRIN